MKQQGKAPSAETAAPSSQAPRLILKLRTLWRYGRIRAWRMRLAERIAPEVFEALDGFIARQPRERPPEEAFDGSRLVRPFRGLRRVPDAF